jgi:hypothetical protein
VALRHGAGGARVTSAWDSHQGRGVVVAVIDTGATHHADLEPNLLPGYDFITDASSPAAPTTTRAGRLGHRRLERSRRMRQRDAGTQ